MNAPLFAVLLQLPLLEVRMEFDLIHGRSDGAFFTQNLEVVHVEIGDTYGSHFACTLQRFEVSPCRCKMSVMLQISSAVRKQREHRRCAMWIHSDGPD